jgi:hypothetical protein
VISWLVRKPGAFARYRYREDLFPCVTFRRAYDRLQPTHGECADVEYLRLLQLAATAGEQRVLNVVTTLLDAPARFEYVAVQAGVSPPAVAIPIIHIPLSERRGAARRGPITDLP